MDDNQKTELALSPYRILDLTEGGCLLGGKIFGDLGADVIKIEPPGGSPSRIGPFYKDIADPEKSLFWYAYNTNKKSITLDITVEDGCELFKSLVATADVVMESFKPGTMNQLGLGYDDLVKIKSDIILTSITPFGQSGPKAHYKGSDLISWASGGYLNLCGDPDRAPVWIGFPQASLHGGAEAAAGTMMALWHRQTSGEGQHVDVSIQECVIGVDFNAPETWDLNRVDLKRFAKGLNVGSEGVRVTHVWQCKDGYVQFILEGGPEAFAGSSRRMVEWMDESGMAADWLKALDWHEDYHPANLTQELVDRVEAAVGKFLLTKTKRELYEKGGLKRRILIALHSTAKDIFENPQLKARKFWVPIDHAELDAPLTYCAPFINLNRTPVEYRYRAPLIGEHNADIYEAEMGLSKEKLSSLKSQAVI